MVSDLRNAARRLAKIPLFTATIVFLVAMGLAANTLIFSLVDALLLRPLPVRNAEQLVRLVTVREPLGVRSNFVLEEYSAWKSQVPELADLAAWSEQDLFVDAGGTTMRARVDFVTENYFSALGTSAAIGRLLMPQDRMGSAGPVPVVLSHHFWQKRFQGSPGVLGQSLVLNGRPAVVVGVTPRTFNGLTVETSPDLRAPVSWLKTLVPDLFEGQVVCEVFGWLSPRFSLAAARQHAEAVWLATWKQLNPNDPGLPGRFELHPAARGISRLRTQFAGVLWLLMGGIALLMLLVCANIAGMLMARNATRQGELAVRIALGASRARLMREYFCEALLLVVGGALGAAVLTKALLPRISSMLPPVRDLTANRLTLSLEIAPDWRVLCYSLTAAAVTLLLFGLLPAFTAARQDVHPFLRQARSGGTWSARHALLAGQVALCTILLFGAALTVETLRQLWQLDAGFDRSRIVTLAVDPDMAGYSADQAERLKQRLLAEARAVPGVESAAISIRGLMRGTGLKTTIAPSGQVTSPSDFMNTSIHAVSPEYFETMRIAWVEGRNFTDQKPTSRAPRPIIVNQAFVRRFSPDRPVLGRTFGNPPVGSGPAAAQFEVIGVVADTKYRSLREPFLPILYQRAGSSGAFILHLRARGEPGSVIAPMREVLSRADSRLSYLEITTLSEEVRASLWPEQVAAALATGFSCAGAFIVAAGLYGLVAFTLAQRRREVGIRMALGATPADVVQLMFGRAVGIASTGVAAGLAACVVLAPRLAPLLFQVKPRDPGLLFSAALTAFAVAALAGLLPSLAARRLHPASVLRDE